MLNKVRGESRPLFHGLTFHVLKKLRASHTKCVAVFVGKKMPIVED